MHQPRPLTVALVAALVVLAGCSAGPGAQSTPETESAGATTQSTTQPTTAGVDAPTTAASTTQAQTTGTTEPTAGVGGSTGTACGCPGGDDGATPAATTDGDGSSGADGSTPTETPGDAGDGAADDGTTDDAARNETIENGTAENGIPATVDDTVVVGARGWGTFDPSSEFVGHDRGRAYVFAKPVNGTQNASAAATTTITGANESNAGEDVAAGDLNGDGEADYAVATLPDEPGESAVHLVYGPTNGSLVLPADADASLYASGSTEAGENLLESAPLAVADVNGDGVDDVLVATHPTTASQAEESALYVVYGPVEGRVDVTTEADAVVRGTTDRGVATTLASAGDVNDDGTEDAVFTAVNQSTEGDPVDTNGSRIAVLVTGPVEGAQSVDELVAREGTTVFSHANPQRDVLAAAGAGDLNGDGYDDVVLGRPEADPTGDRPADARGAAHVVYGPVDERVNLSADADVTYAGRDAGVSFAATVAGAGDVDADGDADLLVGSYGTADSRAFLLDGEATGTRFADEVATATFEGESPDDQTARGALLGTDLNDDGNSDIVVPAPFADDRAGKVYVAYGPVEGRVALGTDADATLTGRAANTYLGLSGGVTRGGDGSDDSDTA